MIDAIADFFTPEVLIFLAAAVVLLCLVILFYPQQNKRMKARPTRRSCSCAVKSASSARGSAAAR